MNVAHELAHGLPEGRRRSRRDASDDRRKISFRHVVPQVAGASWIAGSTAIALALSLLLLAATLAAISARSVRTGMGWAEHANAVLQQIANVREPLLESGIAVRDAVVAGNDTSRPGRLQLRERIVRGLDALETLAGDNAAQRQRVLRLRTLVSARFDAEDRDAMQASRASGRVPGGADHAGFTSAIRTEFAGLRTAELSLLESHQRSAAPSEFRLMLFMGLVVLLALFVSALGIAILERERGDHRVRELQLELMHSQRLGLMNQTSAVLAHELNQPLTAAMNYLGALRRIGGSHVMPDRVEGISAKAETQIRRAKEIVTRLRDFVSNRAEERTIVKPETLILDASALLETLDASVSLQTGIAPDLPPVLVDRIQIQQVMVNLMRNAIDAMEGGVRRELCLSAAVGHSEVVISVRDSGTGLSEDIAATLFMPFVTSKPGGMGVGLSICRAIVASHGGRIWAESVPEKGAVFSFALPALPTRGGADRA